jgi:hypothetical protein
MHQVPYISDNCLDLTLTHLTIVGGLRGALASLYPWVLVRHQGGFEKPSSTPTILSFYILSPIHPSHSPSPGIRMTYLRGYTLSCGKKGLKAQEVKATGKR